MYIREVISTSGCLMIFSLSHCLHFLMSVLISFMPNLYN